MRHYIYKNSRPILVAWALFILFLCAVPGRYVPSEWWMELLSVDKLVHASLFFVLCSLFLFDAHFRNASGLTNRLRVGACVLYGLLLEVLQAAVFVERSMDLYDALANAAGALLAYWLRSRLIRVVVVPG